MCQVCLALDPDRQQESTPGPWPPTRRGETCAHRGLLHRTRLAEDAGVNFSRNSLVNRGIIHAKVLVTQSCLTLCDPIAHSLPWDSPDKNTGSHSLLQGIFLTQGTNRGLLHCRQILYHLSHQGSIIHRAIEQAKDHGLDCSESFYR